jgi:hypothetical protein
MSSVEQVIEINQLRSSAGFAPVAERERYAALRIHSAKRSEAYHSSEENITCAT